MTASGGGSGEGELAAEETGTRQARQTKPRAPTGPDRRSSDLLFPSGIGGPPFVFPTLKLVLDMICVNEHERPAGRPETGLRVSASRLRREQRLPLVETGQLKRHRQRERRLAVLRRLADRLDATGAALRLTSVLPE